VKNFLSKEFNIEHLPQWFCPTCKIGILEIGEKTADIEQTAESKALRWHPNYDHEFVEYTINALLKCNNKKCCETVMSIGSGRVDEYYNYSERGEETHDFVTLFKPIYFYPHLKIFNATEDVPELIVNMLDKSFALFFCDSDSCGNRIRACIEFLLDELKVPRVHRNKQDKEVRSNLHYRILHLPEEYEKIKGLLLAIKWLGNIGSHGNEGLTTKDTIDAYEILKVVLGIIYKPSDAHIFDLANKINEAKGII
jgi:5S rRNA maturation endonuclease (ribonuclease M5)